MYCSPLGLTSLGGKGVASVWGRSGPEGSKRSKKLEAEVGRAVR